MKKIINSIVMFICMLFPSFSMANTYSEEEYKSLVETLKNKKEILSSELKTVELKLKIDKGNSKAIEEKERLKVEIKGIDDCIKVVNKAIKANGKKNTAFKNYHEAKSASDMLNEKVKIIFEKIK